MELFICNDPRFLSGGSDCPVHVDYSAAPAKNREGDYVVTSETLAVIAAGNPHLTTLPALMGATGQQIHHGKSGYHHRPPLNTFLMVDDPGPSVGVELETEEKTTVSTSEMTDVLRSNWFHFESDSSLCTGMHEGYELITEPLPSRAYRDVRLWTGLQNILTPWVESYKHSCTGLHVHVGLDRFRGMFEFSNSLDDMTAGKYCAAAVYLCLCDRAMSDAVFLRKNGSYCCDSTEGILSGVTAAADAGGLTAGSFIDLVTSTFIQRDVSSWTSRVQLLTDGLAPGRFPSECLDVRFVPASTSRFSGHGAEVNCDHDYTIEFRRGKGTLNALSIHRMVEFTTHIVKYVEHMLANPGDKVSKRSFAEYLIENTNSEALKAIVKKGM